MLSEHQAIRAVTLQEPVRKLQPGWTGLGAGLYGIVSFDPSFVNTTLAPSEPWFCVLVFGSSWSLGRTFQSWMICHVHL